LFTPANKFQFFNADTAIALILFGNIACVTFLKIFLEIHNWW